MRYKHCLGLMCGAFLVVTTHAAAQGIPSRQPGAQGPVQSPGSNAIGPNGAFYALVPGTGSTPQTPVTELLAIVPSTPPATLWTASNLSGELGQLLPGANTVFVVQTVVSGTGRSATTTASVLLFSAATGSTSGLTTITPAGNIEDIEVKTVGTTDYLYVSTSNTSSTTSNGTTTVTTTRTLTIYSQTGAKLGAVNL